MLNQDLTYQLCKSKLETALHLFRNNLGEINFLTVGKKHYETKILPVIATLHKHSGNPELVQYYMMAVNRKQNGERDHRTDKIHQIGSFLLRYFWGEAQAITYLEDLLVRMLSDLNLKEQQQLMNEKPIPDAWGPDIKWTDDMWYCGHTIKYKRSLSST